MDCFCGKIKSVYCRIVFLDERELYHELKDDNMGQNLLDVVFRHLNLMETAYFGLRYLDGANQTHWLNPAKKLRYQLKWGIGETEDDPYILYFGVKFYAVDPCKLIEEITRYQFFLQIKQDILQGRLPVSFELAAELGAFIVQSELGDYDPRRHTSGYVSEFRFLQNQTTELETRVAEYHKTYVGLLPSVAELNYLDKVKWLELYGVDLHSVLGEDNVEYFLGLTPSGIVVLRNKTTVGNYYWPRISKIYFKGRYFMLRVTDKNNDESTYGFETPSKSACKHLWKCCLEHHAFFRLYQVSPATAADIFGLGSRFRFSGRTEKQAVQDAKMCIRNPPKFIRTPSRRRIVEGAVQSPSVEESKSTENSYNKEIKLVSIPQPVHMTDSSYRVPSCRDSLRSTRSAPWASGSQRGLYGSMAGANGTVPSSPQSFRSTGTGHRSHAHRHRSSSVDSHSSTDSRTYRRHRHRGTSDNESELSKCSGRSHRRHRRSSGHRHDSGSEPDINDRSKYRCSGSTYELVNSESQWKEVQRQQAIGGTASSVQQASIVSNRRSGYNNSCHESESEVSFHHNRTRRHRKHRSRSRSPGEAKTWLPDELKKHLEFDLIDTAGMSESQLKEIPYTVVETSHAKQLRLKQAAIAKNKTLNTSTPRNNNSKIFSPHGLPIQTCNSINRVKNWSGYNNSSLLIPDLPNTSSNGVRIGLDNGLDNGLRANHEHTDSGLGAEQDYDCLNDRSNMYPPSIHNIGLHENNIIGQAGVSVSVGADRRIPMSDPVSNCNGRQSASSHAIRTLPRASKGSLIPPSSAYNKTTVLLPHNNALRFSANTGPLAFDACTGSLGRMFVHRDGPLRLQTQRDNNLMYRQASHYNEKLFQLLVPPESSRNFNSIQDFRSPNNEQRNIKNNQQISENNSDNVNKGAANLKTSTGKKPDGGEMSTEL